MSDSYYELLDSADPLGERFRATDMVRSTWSSHIQHGGPVSALLVAVLLGYLWFNAHPARVIMGDMGSHAIGAVAAGAYLLYADLWLLPVAALIPVVEVLSVVIQVAYFKRTGKRVFRMSPIHHHFELSGWPETHVTVRFWVITAAMTSLAWWLLGGRP